jgi:hypothetical protein
MRLLTHNAEQVMSQPTEYNVYYLATEESLFSGPYVKKDDAIEAISQLWLKPADLRVVEMRAMGTPVYFFSNEYNTGGHYGK